MSVLKCKNCKSDFIQYNSIQKLCFDCTIKKAKLQVQKTTELKWKLKKKAYKESKTNYFKLLQSEINKTARLIDYGQVCISCQKMPKKINGCHFLSSGGHKNITYNLLNIYLGCEKCNNDLGGNIHGYDAGLIQEFGKEFWEYLKFDMMKETPILQIRQSEAKEKLKIVREINNEIELIKRSPIERIEKRKEINKIIGIYGNNQD